MRLTLFALGLSAFLALSGCSLVLDFEECTSDSDCEGPGAKCLGGYCQGQTVDSVLEAPCTKFYGVELNEALSEDTILLGTILPFTGQLGTFGPSMDQSVELAVTEINQVGGLNGKKFAVVSCDSGTDPAKATEAAQHLADLGVQAVVGPAASSITIEVFQQVARDAGMVFMSPSATSPGITDLADDGLLWRTAPSDAGQGAAIAEYLIWKGYQKVAVVNRDDAYGNGLASAISDTYCAKASCGDNYFARTYGTETQESDQSEIIVDLKGFDPEVIVIISFFTDGIAFVKSAASVGYKTFVGSDGIKSPALMTGNEEASGIDDPEVLCNFVGTIAATPAGEEYQKYELRYKGRFDEPPGAFAANAYDGAYLLAYAYAAAAKDDAKGSDLVKGLRRLSAGTATEVGNTDWNATIQKLANDPSATVDFVGASGELDFDPSTGEATSSIEMWYLNTDDQEVDSAGVIYTADRQFLPPEISDEDKGASCVTEEAGPDSGGDGG